MDFCSALLEAEAVAVVPGVAFGLEPGQIAGPIPTLIGYHIIQVIERAERPVEPERMPLLMENAFLNWLDGQYRAAIIERYQ